MAATGAMFALPMRLYSGKKKKNEDEHLSVDLHAACTRPLGAGTPLLELYYCCTFTIAEILFSL